MKIKKHLLNILLVAMMFISQIAVPVFANEKPENLALKSSVTVSGCEVDDFPGKLAVDGDRESNNSRWSSAKIPSSNHTEGEDQWLILDLGEAKTFNQIDLYWEASAGIHYSLQGKNGENDDWETFYNTESGDGGLDSILLDNSVTYQYVRLYITYGNGRYSSVSLYEIELYNYSDDLIAQGAIDTLSLPNAVKENFTLKTSEGDVSISYTSNNDLIKIENDIAVVSIPAVNTWVELTATAVYKTATLQKTFKVMVMTPETTIEDYVIYPTPQNLSMKYDILQLTDTINVIYGNDIETMVKDRVKEVFSEHGYNIVENSDDTSLTKLYVGIHGLDDQANKYANDNNIATTVFNEATVGYDKHILSIDNSAILVLGQDNDSAYYAMASLDQILKQTNNKIVTTVLIEDYADTQYRGVVEGYYGIPFSVEDRLSIFEYMKDYKMNMFVYGPKGDPYHLGNWMDDYPTTVTEQQRQEGLITQSDIKAMSTKASQCNVDFVWSSHPAMLDSIDFSTDTGIVEGTEKLMTKFDHMYDLGVRQFAIFVDDIDLTIAYNQRSGQAKLLNDVWHALEAKYNGEESTATSQVKPLYFVPSFYALNFGNSASRDAYLREIGTVDQDILIGFTGTSVFSSVTSSSMKTFANLVGRDPVMWWNYPVNDGDDDELFMAPLGTPYGNGRTFTVENNITNLAGLLSNPMNQAEASKVSFFGVADYSWNTGTFNASENWEASFNSYSDDPKIANAIKIFASYSASQYDGANITSLFNTYKNDRSNAAAIREKMEALIDACNTILALEGGNNTELSNLANEIAPWARKLRDMATIINNSLIVLEADKPTDVWSTFATANTLYNDLVNNPDYMVDSIEGQGSAAGGSPVQYEALPANSYVRPFADYIIIQARNIYALPQKGKPAIISNVTDETPLMADVNDERGIITGLDKITLQPGEYIGIDFKAISPIKSIDVTLAPGLVLQGSINGKEWTTIEADTDLSFAYIRVKNTSNSASEFDLSSLSVNMIIKTKIINGETNVGIYQNYYMNNTYDGNYETFAWTAANQAVGDTMTWTLNQTIGIKDVTLTFTGSDPLSDKAVIEISKDGNEWIEIGSTSRDYLIGNNYTYSCDGNNQEALYVRMRITSVGLNAWLRVYEIEVNKEANEQLAKPQAYLSNGNSANVVADRDVSTYYTLATNDVLTYQLIDNVKAESINILYTLGDKNDGNVEAFVTCDEGEVSLGILNGENNTFDVSNYHNIKNILIKTNGQSITVYDIYESGTPYQEANKAALITAIETVPEKDQSAYTTESYEAYLTALSQANTVVNNVEASQEDVNGALATLQLAYDQLVERPVSESDKTTLLEAIDKANALNEKDYTDDSWAALVEALNNANSVADKDVVDQEEVDKATASLNKAIDNLVKIEVPSVVKDELLNILNKYDGLTSSDYTKETWDPFFEAYNQAKAVYENEAASQEEVDNAIAKLDKAAKALEKASSENEQKPGDTTPPKVEETTEAPAPIKPAADTLDNSALTFYTLTTLVGLCATILFVKKRKLFNR